MNILNNPDDLNSLVRKNGPSDDNYNIFISKYKSLPKDLIQKQWYNTSKYDKKHNNSKKIVINSLFYSAFTKFNERIGEINEILTNDLKLLKKLTLVESLLIIMFENINYGNQFFLFVHSFHVYLNKNRCDLDKIDRLYDRFFDNYIDIFINIIGSERDNLINNSEYLFARNELYYLFFILFFDDKYQIERKIIQYIKSYDIMQLYVLLNLLFNNNDTNFSYYYEKYIFDIEDDIEEYLKDNKMI